MSSRAAEVLWGEEGKVVPVLLPISRQLLALTLEELVGHEVAVLSAETSLTVLVKKWGGFAVFTAINHGQIDSAARNVLVDADPVDQVQRAARRLGLDPIISDLMPYMRISIIPGRDGKPLRTGTVVLPFVAVVDKGVAPQGLTERRASAITSGAQTIWQTPVSPNLTHDTRAAVAQLNMDSK